ncbi:MAG: nucleotidyl transferase AbiEii/AbiGii toxin family protein [Lachnospiraceae bacterium]|nr:nucleotidyl transferase AbiEii/AbiGii toxin family protein [Lachnospiraceae bacterium]MDD7049164.1 nucleotidyl transferase AbiEii/AbiGii toxin family protein [Lachnospiraceae bacterium]
MYGIAKAPEEERQVLFINTAARMGMNEAVVEKDFWVCLTLDYLFHRSKWKSKMTFKGGTSLSKVYHLIERFSEDIDLILDWRVLGYGKDEPWEPRSNTKQQKFIAESRERLFTFLAEDFLPVFRDDMSKILGKEVNGFIAPNDDGTVCFEYPGTFHNQSILRVIRLEIGALAAWTPTQLAEISPYAAEQYPRAFLQRATTILTTTAERSFWEKATILHQEAFRPDNSTIPARYSRHYYDLYSMAGTYVKESALSQPELLEKVANFKMRFYPRGWAHYELARIGTLKLLPAKHSISRLEDDYTHMKSMIYGKYPDFGEILEGLSELEKEINTQAKS